jgi:hypothetical protein
MFSLATPTRAPKTETLSLRLNPKTRFMLEFMARAMRRSVTSVVELAIEEAAEKTSLNDGTGYNTGSTWKDFWDPEEAIRSIKLISNSKWASYEEELLHSFVCDHWPFFFTDSSKNKINRKNVQILWPKMEIYQQEFRDNRNNEYHSAGYLMAIDLERAGITAPKWPRSTPDQPIAPSSTKRSFAADLEDDIPF